MLRGYWLASMKGRRKGWVYLSDDPELLMASVSRETFFSPAAFSGW